MSKTHCGGDTCEKDPYATDLCDCTCSRCGAEPEGDGDHASTTTAESIVKEPGEALREQVWKVLREQVWKVARVGRAFGDADTPALWAAAEAVLLAPLRQRVAELEAASEAEAERDGASLARLTAAERDAAQAEVVALKLNVAELRWWGDAETALADIPDSALRLLACEMLLKQAASKTEEARLRAVVDALPRCTICNAVATSGARRCDAHHAGWPDLPYAEALRALTREPHALGLEPGLGDEPLGR